MKHQRQKIQIKTKIQIGYGHTIDKIFLNLDKTKNFSSVPILLFQTIFLFQTICFCLFRLIFGSSKKRQKRKLK